MHGRDNRKLWSWSLEWHRTTSGIVRPGVGTGHAISNSRLPWFLSSRFVNQTCFRHTKPPKPGQRGRTCPFRSSGRCTQSCCLKDNACPLILTVICVHRQKQLYVLMVRSHYACGLPANRPETNSRSTQNPQKLRLFFVWHEMLQATSSIICHECAVIAVPGPY